MGANNYKKGDMLPPKGQILLYQTEDGRQRIEVRLQDETVWLSQRLMAELFQVGVNTVNYHIKEIFADGELMPEATIRKYRIVRTEGKRAVERQIDFYNLDMIIAVGYRVRSHRGTQFRQWATERLREFIIKGFVLDDERLSEPGGIDYFDELLDRIRAIRASEKRFYQKVRDIYTLSADYDPKSPMTLEFFATVQNKMLYAATGMTAAELIYSRADSSKPNMGLTTWKGAGRGRQLTKQDTETAKNYLNQEEMKMLGLLVNQYLDFAELQARQRKVMYMADWKVKLDAFLKLNDRDILTHAGKISAKIAKELAHGEYNKFAKNRQMIEADRADEELRKAVLKLTGGEEE
ncbi:virulence RhuM family protein [Syntrophaceticus schinkii]|jgi:hypothetical protein|uniref:Virulence protein n=1 Tax=Syntrophaceticus schinkii TaxID=499207 RepID=A0A0B7MMZ2_9FIRM|nr:virulence RhuM family protein [Syntrophaceticus schinkii]MDD2359183.1 virulence RhuM family protein [Syntrophaceticus schinkii]MDD4261618.1 virulence RhuM family protein [Syntrophaceticus schinkii]MDD4674906.1 virulence RhuM family protein [Syntrophaceticus schinkii]CEO89321.1 conserved hypothetical protein [Syntrophaceticus schinkii]